ncbi:cilia- and flagella-associated protein 184 [Anableps anableps]
MEKENEENEEIAEIVFSDHEDELSSSRDVKKDPSVEEAATCGPEQSSSEQVLSLSQSVIFEIDSSNNGGFLGLNLETPKRETPPQEEGEGSTAAATDNKKVQYEDSLRELSTEPDEARQLNRQLQMKLAEYFHNRPIDGGQLRRDRPEEEQLQEYEEYIQILSELKQQLSTASETAQQQAEELRLRSQEKLDKVEEEWEAFMALKQDAAVMALSRRLGKEHAWSKVQSVLAAERLRQNELTKLRLKHFKLRFKIHRLETELRGVSQHGEDPLQVQFEQLQAIMLERKKQAERESEESTKLQKKTSRCLEVLTHTKEKLYWSQMEVQAKRRRLAEVEALVAKKRDLLSQTKLARNNLQRDNRRLKERCGLLGNGDLLRHFEETVDASEQLEKRLEDLKFREAEISFRCGTWRQKPVSPGVDPKL